VSARDAILAAIRRAAVPPAELPDLLQISKVAGEAPTDLVRRFIAMLKEVGGRAVELAGPDELFGAVAVLPAVRAGRGIVSSVPELDVSILTLGPDASRAQLDAIELAIIPGRLGVAENAAVWVDEADLPHRALPFVSQHLAIVLPKHDIVADMHAAYARLPRPLPGYGVFISGPSKTADIEQALVIGAQGPKSLVVFLV
jgi:L-lactate dehydrogenase complex protein LldG